MTSNSAWAQCYQPSRTIGPRPYNGPGTYDQAGLSVLISGGSYSVYEKVWGTYSNGIISTDGDQNGARLCQETYPTFSFDCVDVTTDLFLEDEEHYANFDGSSWVHVDSPAGNVPYPGITQVVCGQSSPPPTTPPPPPGFDLAVLSVPSSIEWGAAGSVVVRVTPDSNFQPANVDVSLQVAGGSNVSAAGPSTQTIALATTPVDVSFSLTPLRQNSRLGCVQVDVEASGPTDEEDESFEIRVRPEDGNFTKIFDDTNGMDDFVGRMDTNCMTPALPGQPPEAVFAKAFQASNGIDVNLERNGQGPRMNPGIFKYDLSPQCMVAFKQVPDAAGTIINWNTIGFPRVVDRDEITRKEITLNRQSKGFAPNQFDQIWMAPDGTAHVQATDIIMTPGGGTKRDVLAWDNITGTSAQPPGVVCDVITDVRRQGPQVLIESETQPTEMGQGGDECRTTVLSFSVPTCD